MPRTIPVALQTHLDTGTTTTCHLLRIVPVRAGAAVVGVTDLDREVVYNDGNGALTYLAPVGFVPSAQVSTADFGVDNAEAQGLFPEYDIPQISEADVRAGVYDYATYRMYLVNYENLAAGHVLVMSGTMGQMRVVDGVSFLGEQRSLFQKFRQTIVERDSLTCRATFGSQPIGTGGGVVEERFPCGIDAEALFVNATVTAVGAENTLTFTASSLTQAAGFFVPGLLEWLTGNNAGRQVEVEGFAGGVVTLAFPAEYPITIGDTLRIRPDCTKQWAGAVNSCQAWNNRLKFRGEPFIPVADAGQLATPGAGVGAGSGGSIRLPGVEVPLP